MEVFPGSVYETALLRSATFAAGRNEVEGGRGHFVVEGQTKAHGLRVGQVVPDRGRHVSFHMSCQTSRQAAHALVVPDKAVVGSQTNCCINIYPCFVSHYLLVLQKLYKRIFCMDSNIISNVFT